MRINFIHNHIVWIVVGSLCAACGSTWNPQKVLSTAHYSLTPIASSTPDLHTPSRIAAERTPSGIPTRITEIPKYLYPTYTPAPTSTHIPTQDIFKQIVISPNQLYTAKLYTWLDSQPVTPTIRILDQNGSILWEIEEKSEFPRGDPHPSLCIDRFSNNSQMLYYYDCFGYDGAWTLWKGLNLRYIQLNSGDLKRVLPGEGLMAFAFSPDERFIAYTRIQDFPRRLFILDFRSGLVRSVTLRIDASGFNQVGWIFWSPDSENILFHTESNENLQAIYLDLETMNIKVISEYIGGTQWFDRWVNHEVIRYISEPMKEVIELDLSTGLEKTILGTATLTPNPK